MKEKEIIKQFVLSQDMTQGRESCFFKALEDARRLYKNEDLWARLDSSDFEKLNEDKKMDLLKGYEIPFLSLIGYLILLDLIGNVFTKKENIVNAIEKFGFPELKECKYIVAALRNSLAHNYGLVNVPANSKYDENSLHKFTLSERENNDGKIFSRKQEWKREDWTDKCEDTSTVVDIKKLINGIEKLIENLQEKARNEELSICLDGSIEELYARFTIIKS